MKNIKLSITKDKEQGFTVIEVLLAILLLGIVGLAVLAGISTALRANDIAGKRATAMMWAQRQLEALEIQPYTDTGIYTAIIPDSGYSIVSYNADDSATTSEIIGYPWDTNNGFYDNSVTGIQRVKLAVLRNGNEVLTFETYKVSP